MNYAHILILWWSLVGSSMVMAINGHDRSALKVDYDTHDVTNFGAVGDGKTDDINAFQSAWKAACGVEKDGVKISVPSGKTFLISPVDFVGPCKAASFIFEILGNIVAPPKSTWKNNRVDKWLYFHGIAGLIMEGNGVGLIDGQGDTWWKDGLNSARPNAMQFSRCNKLQLKGLKHRNSPKVHVSITSSNDSFISNLDIEAPQESPNTDGLAIIGSSNLQIHDCFIGTGDDCIAIKGGSSYLDISNITCGPGHGISIGSLGGDGQHDEVAAISVTHSTFNRSDNGVRIKTWQGGSGFVRNVTFADITFIATNKPVFIDQYYCPHSVCANQPSALQISDVRYHGLHGTSAGTNAAVNFSCSQTVPCTGILLDDVNIQPADPNSPASAYCLNAYGEARAVNPVMSCLLK